MSGDPGGVVIVGLDLPFTHKGRKDFKREYLAWRGGSLQDLDPAAAVRADHKSLFHDGPGSVFPASAADESVQLFLYPTRTYAEGFSGNLLAELAPEDRVVSRKLAARFPGKVKVSKVPLGLSSYFAEIPGYFSGEEERKKYEAQKKEPARAAGAAEAAEAQHQRPLVGFDTHYLRNVGEIFRSCMTRPNRQDFFYLATKTFGVNLAVRAGFAVKGVLHGDLPLARAVIATSWYQVQDIVFTIFGQTYMKFLGRMTGLLRVYKAYIGDFLFVYVQFCFFEFLNRLLLGPIGENPLAYTWRGMGLILLNNLQGLISGGPLVPAINKIRKAGLISHPMMMHLYQLGSLCFYFGLFASYGYQKIYFCLTTGVMVFAWSSYLLCSTLFKDPEFLPMEDPGVISRLDRFAAAGYAVYAASPVGPKA